jgi:hypothetical protein
MRGASTLRIPTPLGRRFPCGTVFSTVPRPLTHCFPPVFGVTSFEAVAKTSEKYAVVTNVSFGQFVTFWRDSGHGSRARSGLKYSVRQILAWRHSNREYRPLTGFCMNSQ